MTDVEHLEDAFGRALAGGPERHRAKAAEQGKLPVRERVARLLDDGSFVEEALLANWQEDGLGADGVVTGSGTIGGRPVSVKTAANSSMNRCGTACPAPEPPITTVLPSRTSPTASRTSAMSYPSMLVSTPPKKSR